MANDPKFRRAQLTINNPEQYNATHEAIIYKLHLLSLDYFALVDEIGESGTYHTHIYIVFRTSCRFSTLKKRFPEAHIERALGNSIDNRNYLLKIGKWEKTKKAETTVSNSFYEEGTLPDPESEKKNLMEVIQAELEDGFSTSDIIRAHPALNFRSKDIDTLRETIIGSQFASDFRNIEVVYVFGDTGTGKTSGIYAENKVDEICRITNYANPRALFDSYHGQKVLVFEEYHSQIPMPDMLSYLDIYPLALPARYSDRVACYTKVYITSNLSLNEQYPYYQRYQPKTWEAFLRRIHIVRRYTDVGVYEDFSMEGGFIPL